MWQTSPLSLSDAFQSQMTQNIPPFHSSYKHRINDIFYLLAILYNEKIFKA
jgi:hypothetical protein